MAEVLYYTVENERRTAMAFCDNLLYLRKKAKITQEDLAAELEVSRQSVSKWETGEAYPETDKLIALCEKFGVTLDELVRGNCCGDEEVPGEGSGEDKDEPVYTDAREYKRKALAFARMISLGVFLILFGVACCVALAGVSALFDAKTGEVYAICGGAVVLLFVAAAVFLFVYGGISDQNFRRAHPRMGEMFKKEERESFGKKFMVSMACLVSGILLDVVALIVGCLLVDRFAGELAETVMCFLVAAFLLLLGALVGGLCYMGILHDRMEGKNNRNGDIRSDKVRKICDGVSGAVMLVATAVYLFIGFVWNMWHPGWIVFPVGGIICAIVSTVGKIFDKNDE